MKEPTLDLALCFVVILMIKCYLEPFFYNVVFKGNTVLGIKLCGWEEWRLSHKYSCGAHSEGTCVYDFITSVTNVPLSKLVMEKYDGKERSPSVDAILQCDKG